MAFDSRAVAWVLGALLLVSVGLNAYLMTKGEQFKVVEKVTTRVVRDTVRDTVPEVRFERVLAVRRDTMRVVERIEGDTVHMVVEVPEVQREYSDDSTYRAWVSGYNPRLDSIDVFRKTVFTDREVVRTKRNRFVIGPQVGYSYDFQSGKVGPTVGIGITYVFCGF